MKKAELLNSVFQTAFLTALVFIATSDAAFAQTLQQTVTSVNTSTKPLITTVSFLAYIIGGAFGISGALGLKNHAENPQTKLVPQLAKLGVAGGLIALPALTETLQKTLATTGTATYTGLNIP